jgi:predicted ATPase/transcriptional regulator with XRE-family HTH domain
MTVVESEQLGALIRRLRLEAGLSQEQLAERAGLSARAVSDLERGQRAQTRPETLRMLAEGLALEKEDRQALFRASRPELRTPPAAPVPAGPGSGLPAARSELIGRDREVSSLLSRLGPNGSASRLMTLTGPGGVGKTRLAIEAARLAAPSFPDGVIFVDLSPVTDSALVPSAIARVMSIHDSGDQSLGDTLRIALHNRSLLLLLDNFEQVIDAAPVVAELLAGTTALHLLVTSREPLRIHGEHEVVVEPLELPDPSLSVDGPGIVNAPAVTLFAATARIANPAFELTAEASSAVAEICRRLDGLPLAIELAASRVKHFPPATLLEHLDRRLPVLTGGARDLPARQQTLRDTISWSYDLLSPDEQALFRRLGVFAGGASISAIQTVVPAAGVLELDLLAGLSSLVDKSLVRERFDHRGAPRLSMLETIREFANEQVLHSGELEPARAALAAWVLAFVERGRKVDSAFFLGAANLRELEEEIDNIRLSFDVLADRGDAVSSARLFVSIYDYFYIRGLLREGEAMGRKVLALAETDPLPAELQSFTLNCLSTIMHNLTDSDETELLAREALAVVQPLPEAVGEVVGAQLTLGMALRDQGRFAEAMTCAEQAYTMAARMGDEEHCAIALYHMGRVALLEGKLDEAVDRFRQASDRGLAFGPNELTVYAANNLADAHVRRGDTQSAASTFRAALRLWREAGSGVIGLNLTGVAGLAAIHARPRIAAMLVGAESTQHALYGYFSPNLDAWSIEVNETVRKDLGDGAYEAAILAGQQLDLEEALALALEVIDGIEAESEDECHPD